MSRIHSSASWASDAGRGTPSVARTPSSDVAACPKVSRTLMSAMTHRLLERDEDGDQPAPGGEAGERLADHGAERAPRVARAHRVARRAGGREQVADPDRAAVGLRPAPHLAGERERPA